MPSLSSPIRVLIVDDSPLVRRGIRALLGAKRARRTISIVGEATTVAEAVRGATRLKPDVVLLDVRLPDGSGIEACRHIIERQPETSVLILTSHAGDNLLYESVVAGAKGYLMKEIDGEALTTAIIDVAEGRVVLTPDTTARMLRIVRAGPAAASPQPEISKLSHQEKRVLTLVAGGQTNRAIGRQLGLSEHTVKNYLVNVFDKLRVKRRSQAAALFVQAKDQGQ